MLSTKHFTRSASSFLLLHSRSRAPLRSRFATARRRSSTTLAGRREPLHGIHSHAVCHETSGGPRSRRVPRVALVLVPSRAFAAGGLLWDDQTASLLGHEPRDVVQAEAAAEERERAWLADFERRNFLEFSDCDVSLLNASRSDSSGALSARSSRQHSPLALDSATREQLHTLEVLVLVPFPPAALLSRLLARYC